MISNTNSPEQARGARNMSEQRFLGAFGAAIPTEHYGELTVNGANTAIRLIGQNLTGTSTAKTIYGQTTRGKVSCVDCISTGAQWTFDGVSKAEQATIFPHYVTHGDVFFDPEAGAIAGVMFRFTDIDVLFGWPGSVGSFVASPALMESILVEAKKESRSTAGETPVVSYFDGQAEVWSIQTAIGKISVRNVLEFDAQHPFTHRLVMSITFDAPIGFTESVDRLHQVRQCMTVIAGRAQALDAIKLTLYSANPPGASGPTRLNLEWCLSPQGPAESDLPLRRFALPLDRLRRPGEFSTVLSGWFARDKAWHWPRTRYVECIEHGRNYSADRLVAAANMFDLLPDSIYVAPGALEPDVAEAVVQAKAMFRRLPGSIDRDSVLNALGRVGKLSLPKKVGQRGDIVLSHLDAKLPSLQTVLKAAIQCRNHLVHGSDFDIDAVEPFIALMTDSLEFVFIASDLIELGWQAAMWAECTGSGGHRFAEFLDAYGGSIEDFVKAYEGRAM
jgi:hypothetical protein